MRVRLTVAYDGSAFPASPPTPGCATVGGHARPRASSGRCGTRSSSPAPAAPTPGCTPGARSSASTCRPTALDLRRELQHAGQPALRRRPSSCARRPVAAADFDARFSARARRLPLHGAEPAGARPVPGPHRLARRATRSTCALLRLACDPLIGEHDFSSFCRRPEGRAERPSRRVADPAGDRRPVGRPRRRRAALRDRGQRVLPPDGAQHRRHAGRGRARADAGRRDGRRSCARATARRPASWPRPRACACGRSATDRRDGVEWLPGRYDRRARDRVDNDDGEQQRDPARARSARRASSTATGRSCRSWRSSRRSTGTTSGSRPPTTPTWPRCSPTTATRRRSTRR